MKPGTILMYAVGVYAVISAGNQMEVRNEEQGPVDEGLEEQQAKKQQGS